MTKVPLSYGRGSESGYRFLTVAAPESGYGSLTVAAPKSGRGSESIVLLFCH
jgi:hypothetical protein